MDELTQQLMEKQGCKGAHCGNCVYWMTELMIGGQYCGWVGSCWNPKSPADRFIEADDYCRQYRNKDEETPDNDD